MTSPSPMYPPSNPCLRLFISLLVLTFAFSASCQAADHRGPQPPRPKPVASLSTHSVSFPDISAGGTGAQTITLSNTGRAILDIAGIGLAGEGDNLFTQSNTCGTSVAAGASCNISVTFSPRVAGEYETDIVIADNAEPSRQIVRLNASATPAALTIDTTDASDWKISNGSLKIDWSPLKGNIFGISFNGSENLVDVTNTSGGIPKGLYMDNAGFGSSTPTATYSNAGSYLDWSITYPSNATNAYTYSEHFIVTPNDPGIHVYFVANHAASDIAGGIGQVQWVFRDNLSEFTNTYSVDSGLHNTGPTAIPLPDSSEMFTTAPGRAVQDATVDLHGLPVPAGFTRQFYTKYDYSSYEYLHKAHGLYGSRYGVWTVIPSSESLVGGPTKQNLIFTGNLLMMEAYSNHLDNELSLATPSGTESSRLFGPFYIHFNSFGQAYNQRGNTLRTPADMYRDALQAGAGFRRFYDSEQQLLESGYVPSTARGSVLVHVRGAASFRPHTAWAVLSDPQKNFQYSSQGHEYWKDISALGIADFTGVIPGTYRLSVYVLGQWGELRQDDVVVKANQPTFAVALNFVRENFGTTAPLFTIGIPDRSAHEFLHGHDARGNDDREFWGNWNYWADFEANQGAVVYNATSGPAGMATDDLSKWNYNHFGVFNPKLYAGIYNPADQTTDGYKYIVPSYVANPASTRTPNWQVHFATPSGLPQLPSYVVLSTSLACAEGSYVVTLNGQQLVWHFTNASDCIVRSGLSGYTQWMAFQWDSSVLNPPGEDNILTIGVSQSTGDSDDALRLELTNTSADPAVRGWNDYEYIYKSTDTKPNDALPNP